MIKIIKLAVYSLLLFFTIAKNAESNDTYFPPLTGDNWESYSPEQLGWNIEKITPLYQYLDDNNSKAFILIMDGRIVLEKYFDQFTKDSLWYWASAGKSLTAALVGIAQEEGNLSISEKTSKYLGEGWTSAEGSKEDLITIKHQLTMTTGLDYQVDDIDCTDPECLKFKADAGTQWYYHNAPYTLLEKVVEISTGMNYNIYTAQKIRSKIGMNGAWVKIGFNNVYFSNARSFARFGLMISENGEWSDNTIIGDKLYLKEMITKSQDLNQAYGYLWWLNGSESYKLPGTTILFPGQLYPDAPNDVYSAMGKDGQCLNISPNQGIVWIRMGEAPDQSIFISSQFNNNIWKFLNDIIRDINSIDYDAKESLHVFPNPANDYININLESLLINNSSELGYKQVIIFNSLGEIESIYELNFNSKEDNIRIDISNMQQGIYFIKIGNLFSRLVVAG